MPGYFSLYDVAVAAGADWGYPNRSNLYGGRRGSEEDEESGGGEVVCSRNAPPEGLGRKVKMLDGALQGKPGRMQAVCYGVFHFSIAFSNSHFSIAFSSFLINLPAGLLYSG